MTVNIPVEHFSELEQAVHGVVAHYSRARAPAPADDMEQEAWRIAIAAYRKFDPAFGSRLYSYAYAAVKRSLWMSVARWTAVPTIKKRFDLSEALSRRTAVRPEHAVVEVSPEEELAEREEDVRRRWRLRKVHRLARGLLRRLPDEDAEIVARHYGLDGRVPEGRGSIAKKLGVEPQRVSRALSRYSKEARGDAELWSLHQHNTDGGRR